MKRRQFFERTAAGQGNSTIVMANNWPGQVIVVRDEECPGMVTPYSRRKTSTGMRSTLAVRCAKSDVPIVAVGLVEAETCSAAESLARDKYFCFVGQRLELRPVSQCAKALLRLATEAKQRQREADELMTEVLP